MDNNWTRNCRGGVWVLILIVSFVFLCVSCSSNSPVTPTEGDSGENNPPKWAFWTTDQALEANTDDQKNVDVTNVVLGAEFMNRTTPLYDSTNGDRGFILNQSHDIPDDEDPVEMNVTAWNESDGEYWTVYFAVIVDGTLATTTPIEVTAPGEGDMVHPAVTAWIDRESEEGGGYLVVDIVFQFNETEGEETIKSIYRQQWTQDTEEDYDDFSVSVGVHAVQEGDEATSYLHPDVVYATYWESSYPPETYYIINDIYVTYERLDSNGRDILYSNISALEDTNLTYSWGVVYNDTLFLDEPGWLPRIDAGIDNFDDNDDYLVAFVWHVYTDDGVSVCYAYRILNTASPTTTTPVAIDNMDGDDSYHNGVPYVDIDPLENRLAETRENYTHIVWSKVIDNDPWDVEPYYRNSSMIEDSVSGVKIYSTANPLIEGLPVISTYADQDTGGGDLHGTVEFLSYYSTILDYPVWSVDFWLDEDDANDPRFSASKTIVSENGHHSDEAGPAWIHGPSSAVYGSINTVCAWTEHSLTTTPDIYYDIN